MIEKSRAFAVAYNSEQKGWEEKGGKSIINLVRISEVEAHVFTWEKNKWISLGEQLLKHGAILEDFSQLDVTF